MNSKNVKSDSKVTASQVMKAQYLVSNVSQSRAAQMQAAQRAWVVQADGTVSFGKAAAKDLDWDFS